MKHGLFGTGATLMMDIIVLSLMVVIPWLLYSLWAVKKKRNFALHRKLQLSLFAVLFVAVVLFELEMRFAGGYWEITKSSKYHGTWVLDLVLYLHLPFAIGSFFLWSYLVVASLLRFDSVPKPNQHSQWHRRWGWAAVIMMVLNIATGLNLYVVGFLL